MGGEGNPLPVLWIGDAADLVAAADFNGDGEVECVAGRYDSSVLQVHSGLESRVRLAGTVELPAPPVALASGDYDGDGSVELVVGMVDGRIAIYGRGGDGLLTLMGTVGLPAAATDLDVADTPTKRLLVAATGSGVQVFSGDARTPAEPAVSSAVREAVDRLADFAPRTALDRLMAGAGLTARERDVVAHAATGMSARDIGERLFIGTRTVETHLARAYHKLGVKSRIELLLRSIGSSTGPPNPGM